MMRTVHQAMIGRGTGERARTLKRLNTSSSCSGGSSKPSCDRRVRSALRPLCLPGRPSDTACFRVDTKWTPDSAQRVQSQRP